MNLKTLPRKVLPFSFLLSFPSVSCFALFQQFLLPPPSAFWHLSGLRFFSWQLFVHSTTIRHFPGLQTADINRVRYYFTNSEIHASTVRIKLICIIYYLYCGRQFQRQTVKYIQPICKIFLRQTEIT